MSDLDTLARKVLDERAFPNTCHTHNGDKVIIWSNWSLIPVGQVLR